MCVSQGNLCSQFDLMMMVTQQEIVNSSKYKIYRARFAYVGRPATTNLRRALCRHWMKFGGPGEEDG